MNPLMVYDTLQRTKLEFKPLTPGFVGLYVCGPTVYGHSHLGHARPYVTFDVVVRYLRHLGNTVRYVRNITDVGHLERDADEGEDKIGKLAKLEQLEPMEVAHRYTMSFRKDMELLNVGTPSIEPHASGHITEQIELIQKIISAGLAYVVNGSVYFDIQAFEQSDRELPYGKLSGRVLEELLSGSRDNLDGQDEKRNPNDFALWKKASPEHIMRWDSPWGVGFPGWHLECSAMSAKYLGNQFDIHGGGMDLMFPHHEAEIAQSQAGHGCTPARYWLHCNMLTINGQKMGKSLGNFISLHELFSGNHAVLEQAYSPMTVRFFILQSHYRSTLDFSNAALQASAKGLIKLLNGLRAVQDLEQALADGKITVAEPNTKLEAELKQYTLDCYAALNDDFNTAMVVAALFNMLKRINTFSTQLAQAGTVSRETLVELLTSYRLFLVDILGIKPVMDLPGDQLLQTILGLYAKAKEAKDYGQVDVLRADLKAAGIAVKDTKAGISWAWVE